jgi:hypothetical protein
MTTAVRIKTCLTAVILVALFTLPTVCCQTNQIDKRTRSEIEDTLNAFYQSLSDASYDDLRYSSVGDLATFLNNADRDRLARFCSPYIGIKFNAINNLTIGGTAAEAIVILERGQSRYTQKVEFKLDEDIWKVAGLGELKPEGAPADAESLLRISADRILTAMRNDDSEAIKKLATREYLEGELKGYFDNIERLASGPAEERERYRRNWASLQWNFERVAPFQPTPEEGIVVATVTRQDGRVKWRMTFRLVAGQWKWAGLRPVTEEDLRESGISEEASESGRAGTPDCADAVEVGLGTVTTSSIIGATKLYYRFEVDSLGAYSIYSTGGSDTIGILLDSNCSELEEDDDDGPGKNFLIVRYLEEGTYYIAVRGFAADQSEECELHIEAGEREAEPDDGDAVSD